MQKIFNALNKGFPAILICVVFATVGGALFIPAGGFVTTLPFIVVCTIIPCLIVEKYYYMPVLFFGTTYLFTFSREVPSLLTDFTGGFALFVSIYAAIISLLACIATHFIKKAVNNKKSRWIYVCCASVLLISSVIASVPINGTPWGLVKAKNEINQKISDSFYVDELIIGKVYYVPSSTSYACDVKVGKTNTDIAHLIYKNGLVHENITKRFVTELGADTVLKLTNTLRNNFNNDTFRVEATDIGKSYGKLSVSAKEEAKPYIGYKITIHSEETAKTFTDKVQDYLAVLDGSGIQANKITFVGGAKQKLYYKIEVDMGAPHGSVADLLEPFDTTLPFSVAANK